MSTRREEIKNVAARLFRKRGYKATSMRDIAEAVGIKAASIYNHIKSKQELLSDLLMEIAIVFTKEMEMIQGTSLDATQKLEQLIAFHVRLTIEHTDAIALIAGEWVHLEAVEKSKYVRLRDEYENQFKAIIDQGKAEGLFVNIDTEIILFSTLSTLRWLYSWYSRNRDFDAMELERQMTICLINGILNTDDS